jgi:hypothetical protein
LALTRSPTLQMLIIVLNISKWVYSKWVCQILRFERRICVLRIFFKTQKPFKVGSYPSDVDEIGCEINGKTRPVVPVMLPRPEKVKRRSLLKIFEIVEHCKIEIVSAKCKIMLYPFPIYPFLDVQVLYPSIGGGMSKQPWAREQH